MGVPATTEEKPLEYLASATPNQDDQSSEKTLGMKLTDTAMFGPFAVGMGGAATVGEFFGVLDDDSMRRFAERNLDSTDKLSAGVADYYMEHEKGVRVAADLALGFTAAGVGARMMQSGSWLSRGLTKLGPAGKWVDKTVMSSGTTRAAHMQKLAHEEQAFINAGSLTTKGTAYQAGIQRAQGKVAMDSAKESVGAEVMLYAAMSDNETFFPEDQTFGDYLMWSLVPAAAVSVGGALGMRHYAKGYIHSNVAPKVEAVLNPKNVDYGSIVNTPKHRGVPLAAVAHGLNERIIGKEAAKVGESTEAVRVQEAIAKELEAEADGYIIQMADDKAYGHGIDASYKWQAGNSDARKYMNTMKTYVQESPSGAIPITSLIPANEQTVSAIPRALETRKDSLAQEIRDGFEVMQGLEEGSKAFDNMWQKLQDLGMEVEELNQLTTFVVHADGTAVPIGAKRWNLLDEIHDKNAVKTSYNDDNATIQLGKQHSIEIGADIQFGFDGKLIFTPTKQQPNFTRVVSEHELSKLSDAEVLALSDLTHTYEISTGVLGKKVGNALAPMHLGVLNAWKTGAGATQVRNLPDRELDTIRAAFDEFGFGKRIRQLADDDGFLTLYRGERTKQFASPDNKLNSWTPNLQTAQDFAGGLDKQVISQRVHVDDIIAPVEIKSSGIGHEYEFLVRDNKRLTEVAMTPEQRVGSWVTVQRAVDAYNPAKMDGPIRTSFNSDSFGLDYAATILQKHPQADVRYLTTGGKELRGAEAQRAIQFQSLNTKAESYLEWMVEKRLRDARGSDSPIKLNPRSQLPKEEILRSFNLPYGDGFGDAPIVRLLDELIPEIGTEVPSFKSVYKNLDEVEAAIQKRAMPSIPEEELTQLKPREIQYDGSALKAEVHSDRLPVVVHNANPLPYEPTVDALNDLIGSRHVNAMRQLEAAEESGGDLVSAVYKQWNADPETRAAFNKLATQLIDGTQQGAGIATTHNFAGRSAPILQTLDQWGQATTAAAAKRVEAYWKAEDGTFQRLLARKNSGSRQAASVAIHEINQGWDVLAEPVKLGNGSWGFALDPASARNEKLANDLYGQTLGDLVDQDVGEEGVALLRASWDSSKPIVVDDLGLQGYESMTRLSHKYLDNVNAIRKAYGLPAIAKREWHTPYFNLTDGHVRWMTDEQGRALYPIHGQTFDQVEELASQIVESEFKNNKRILVPVDANQLGTRLEFVGIEFERMVDMSKAGLQTAGKSSKGKTPVAELGPDAFKTMIKRMQGNFDNLTRYANTAAMRSELDQLRSRRQSLPSYAQDKVDARETVFDHAIRSILQVPSLTTRTQRGKTLQSLEDGLDKGLALVGDAYRGVVPAGAHASQKDYGMLNEVYENAGMKLFDDYVDMLERTQKIKVPMKTRKIAAGTAKIVGDYVLRIADLGMPLLNAASLVAVQPAVMKAMQRGDTESQGQWLERIGAISSKVDDNFRMPSTGKMATQGISHMFSPEGRAALERYREMGLLRHDVYERIELITAPIKGYGQRMYDKGVKVLSTPTDKSEELARAASFAMNHAVATKQLGLQGDAAVMFAHKHATANVGDYRAMNKPQMFQSAVTMPAGLFTTWVWNFGQRVFGDLEGGRFGAAGMQLLMQQMMFGADSMPFSEQLFGTSFENEMGTSDLRSRLQNAMPPELYDAFMDGPLSSLSGIDLASRGSVTAPGMLTGDFSVNSFPALSVPTTLVQGVYKTIMDMDSVDGLTKTKMLETLSTYKMNGAISNTATHILGYKVNRHGEMVNAEVNNLVDSIAHTVELQSIEEKQRQRMLNKERRMEMIKAEHMQKMRNSIRPLMRDLERDRLSSEQLNDRINKIAFEYYKANGDIGRFGAWLRQNAVAATTDKASRVLLEHLRANEMSGQGMKLLLQDYGDKMTDKQMEALQSRYDSQ